jgi:hypothetical protein
VNRPKPVIVPIHTPAIPPAFNAEPLAGAIVGLEVTGSMVFWDPVTEIMAVLVLATVAIE